MASKKSATTEKKSKVVVTKVWKKFCQSFILSLSIDFSV